MCAGARHAAYGQRRRARRFCTIGGRTGAARNSPSTLPAAMASSTAIAPSSVVMPPWSDSEPGAGRRAVHHLVEPAEDRQARQQPVRRRDDEHHRRARPGAARAAGRTKPRTVAATPAAASWPRPRRRRSTPSETATPRAHSSPAGSTRRRRLRRDTAPARPDDERAATTASTTGALRARGRHDRRGGQLQVERPWSSAKRQGQAGGDAEDDPGRGEEHREHAARRR